VAGAKAAYEQASLIFLQFLGDDHPSTILARENLAELEHLIREANQGEQE
jgi:hypothetical protein